MDTLKVFKDRRSIRKFQDRTVVADQHLQQILQAASLAPTARNIQPWHFIVVKNKDMRQALGDLAAQNAPFLAKAPVCIVIFCQDTKYYLEDGCAATVQALLCASMLGLGACWVAGDKKDYAQEVGRLLGAPAGYKLVSLIALGYPDEKPNPNKNDITSHVHQERFP